MKKLIVRIEINGESKYAGELAENNSGEFCFSYAEEYLSDPESRPISISLPLEEKMFNAVRTRIFFEGLLPEGFTRRCVAGWMHTDEEDYISILSGLGRECLGAVKIVDEAENTVKPDYLRLSDTDVKKLAQEGATESAELAVKAHLSLTGASGKVGLYYSEKDGKWYLPMGDAPSTHIVKQSHVRLKKIVANEQLCLLTARNLGIEIPESFIIKTDSPEAEDVLFATKRYDRKITHGSRRINGLAVPYRLHQEDFSQALGIAASEKYERNNDGYLKKMFDMIRNYSASPLEDQMKLWDICVFNYLVGNTDNHIKNLSLLYGEDLKTVRLAPAYDIVSTMIYESSTENMALSIGGIYNICDITRDSFEKEAENIGIGRNMAMKHFDFLASKFEKAMENAKTELEEQGFSEVNTIVRQIVTKGGIKNIYPK